MTGETMYQKNQMQNCIMEDQQDFPFYTNEDDFCYPYPQTDKIQRVSRTANLKACAVVTNDINGISAPLRKINVVLLEKK